MALVGWWLAGCATWAKDLPPPRAFDFPTATGGGLASLVAPPATNPSTNPATNATAATAPVVRRPVVVLLHGGFSGEDPGTAQLAQRLAQRGVLAVVPSYRGERRALDRKQSPGRVEFCAGEVDDIRALLRALRGRPDVDGDRVALWGFSHGGCIALRVAEREPALAQVITFNAPTDAAATYQHLQSHPFGLLGYAGLLSRQLRGYVGGDPGQAPSAWADRSPIRGAQALQAPLLLVHGTSDEIVPVRQTCAFRDRLVESGRPLQELRFREDGRPDPTPGPCGPPPVPPSPSGDAPQKAPLELWYWDGQGHLFSRRAREAAEGRALLFLLPRLQAAPASAPVSTARRPPGVRTSGERAQAL